MILVQSTVIYQFSYQANWGLVIKWVHGGCGWWQKPKNDMPHDGIWVCSVPIGKHKIASILNETCKKAGLATISTAHGIRDTKAMWIPILRRIFLTRPFTAVISFLILQRTPQNTKHFCARLLIRRLSSFRKIQLQKQLGRNRVLIYVLELLGRCTENNWHDNLSTFPAITV